MYEKALGYLKSGRMYGKFDNLQQACVSRGGTCAKAICRRSFVQN